MKDHLIYSDYSKPGKHRLSWYIVGDADIGGNLGEVNHTKRDLSALGPADDRDEAIAINTVLETDVYRDSDGFYWKTEREARAMLRAIKFALKADDGGPMPDWAIKASAAGWKPPKGWKP